MCQSFLTRAATLVGAAMLLAGPASGVAQSGHPAQPAAAPAAPVAPAAPDAGSSILSPQDIQQIQDAARAVAQARVQAQVAQHLAQINREHGTSVVVTSSDGIPMPAGVVAMHTIDALVPVLIVAVLIAGLIGFLRLRRPRDLAAAAPLPSLQPVDERLLRLEQALEVIGVEVERVAEGQRYVTKVLAGAR